MYSRVRAFKSIPGIGWKSKVEREETQQGAEECATEYTYYIQLNREEKRGVNI